MFFNECKTLEELKAAFKVLAKKFHPDLGGCVETMKRINAEYEKISSSFFYREGVNLDDSHKARDVDKQVMEAYFKIIALEGLDIELCGCWIWVSGDTRTHKDKLKEHGYMWAPKKSMWYWRAETQGKRYFGKSSIEEIRSKYGSSRINKYAVAS